MPFDSLVKEIAYRINPQCWKSYSGFSKTLKQSVDVQRNEALAKAEGIERLCREAFSTAEPAEPWADTIAKLEQENHALKEQVARLITEKVQPGLHISKDSISWPLKPRLGTRLEFNSAIMHEIGMQSTLTPEQWEEQARQWEQWVNNAGVHRYPSNAVMYRLYAEVCRIMARFIRSKAKYG